jgi:hypothetical protein
MKSSLWLLLVAMLGSGCATTYDKMNLRDEDFAGKPLVIVNEVPFLEQPPELCGPSALYMVAKPYSSTLKLEDVTKLSFSPKASGSYKQDMLSATRRLGLAPYSVKTLPEIIDYLADKTPVVIFHRTGFLWKDLWHYSVLTGYSKMDETFSMHIGPYAYRTAAMSQVLGSWKEGGNWAFVVLPPQKLPELANFQEALDNSLAFLRLDQVQNAYDLSSQMVQRWPEHYEANVVMADALVKLKQNKRALIALKDAAKKEPHNSELNEKIVELTKATRKE